MNRTPFFDFHRDTGAHIVEFAGWELPLHYGSIIEEHQHVRRVGGLFDVSHMGRIGFAGRHARRLLEHVLTRRVSDMKINTCRYSLVCNQSGGVLDDLLVYRFDDRWLLVVNARNRLRLLDHFAEARGDYVVEVRDQTESTAMIACQGPKVIELIGQFSSEVPTLRRFSFCEKNLLVSKLIISRTGYTGEDGIEVILDASSAQSAIKLLLKDRDEAAVLKPVGLGARDTLRIEASLPLYGQELDEETDPYAAGLGFAVDLDKGTKSEGLKIPSFIGQQALKKIKDHGPIKRLIGIHLEGPRTPRRGSEVYANNDIVGTVTSACLSPTLGRPIAMAYVKPGCCQLGESASIAISGQRVEGQVVKLPFYKRSD